MKKIVSIVILGVLLSVLVVPAVASGQTDLPTGCVIADPLNESVLSGMSCTGCDNVETGDADCGVCCLLMSMKRVTDWIFYLMMVFVVVMIVIGGATYMLAAGNPEKAGKGKQMIIYGIIGLVIALIARLIPSVVKMIVGM